MSTVVKNYAKNPYKIKVYSSLSSAIYKNCHEDQPKVFPGTGSQLIIASRHANALLKDLKVSYGSQGVSAVWLEYRGIPIDWTLFSIDDTSDSMDVSRAQKELNEIDAGIDLYGIPGLVERRLKEAQDYQAWIDSGASI